MNLYWLLPVVGAIYYVESCGNTTPVLLFVIDAQKTRSTAFWRFNFDDVRL